ncbi:MAG: alpha-glucan family phosphorylase [Acidobacteriota bacterium]
MSDSNPSCLPTIRTLHVADIELPRQFEKLYDLAYNLWWTWTPAARNLFNMIDPESWSLYRNPVQVLINVEPRQWHPLHSSERFLAAYGEVTDALDEYMRSQNTYFDRNHAQPAGPIAYFSMEYGLHQSLSVYSGGLGILSGDHCKSASDLGLPFVSVGLLYRRGYFLQSIDAEGFQQHIYPEYDFPRLPLRPIASATGTPLIIRVPVPGREIAAKLWLAQIGRVPLVLLDTDIPENDPADRPITNLLYVRGREMRLVQEYLLGIGGVKALRALGIEPSCWHLNEGHVVFMQLERMRELVADGYSLEDAHAQVTRNAVFTTHTPVPAGNEQFDPTLIRKYFQSWCDETSMAMDHLVDLGRAHEGDNSFNLTALGVRTSSYANGVSKLNSEVASRMWRHLYPAEDEQPIKPITNGVHTDSWLGVELGRVIEHQLGENWRELLLGDDGWDAVDAISDEKLWKAHMDQKARLGRFTRSRLMEQHARHGSSPDELRAVGSLFDPNALTIGFARRFATYKRAKLVFADPHRVRAILSNDERPVQLIFAGKAHPADRPGQELIQHIFNLSRSEALAGRVFILENYDMRMGRMLVQGVDVWLNTPRRPMEASGTSGQKVGLNGGLNFSILDGWWPEGFNGRNGWAIGQDRHYDDEAQQDREDADSLYETLETEIIPAYYERDADGLPRRWIAMMKEAIKTTTGPFSSDRMVRDYTVDAYLPAIARGAEAAR